MDFYAPIEHFCGLSGMFYFIILHRLVTLVTQILAAYIYNSNELRRLDLACKETWCSNEIFYWFHVLIGLTVPPREIVKHLSLRNSESEQVWVLSWVMDSRCWATFKKKYFVLFVEGKYNTARGQYNDSPPMLCSWESCRPSTASCTKLHPFRGQHKPLGGMNKKELIVKLNNPYKIAASA